jgi:hypothetical protein
MNFDYYSRKEWLTEWKRDGWAKKKKNMHFFSASWRFVFYNGTHLIWTLWDPNKLITLTKWLQLTNELYTYRYRDRDRQTATEADRQRQTDKETNRLLIGSNRINL